ncbi:hypothetical protein GCM10027446_02790 [Angustibacter peucedani]
MTTHPDLTTGRRRAGRLLPAAVVTGLVLLGLPTTAAHAAPRTQVRAAGAAVSAAAPVGRLSPRGCTVSGATATCDLYASTGTTTFLGRTLPIWGFSTDSAAAPTAPGPLLVVPQGVTVSVTLHNGIAGQQLSLAFPGQRHAAVGSAVGDDLTGIASGGTRTYSFVASRPGTFVYEAGHTGNGTRQVAMGLAGALVVLPSDGTAYGAVSGMPDTSYQDEAVLALSEIDPRLNADPTGFDMRDFAPRYRLINGKPFPETDPVATDQGRRVLLRYVNLGSQSHAMSLLGGSQLQVADDGHPKKYAETAVTQNVVPGQTVDTLLTTPSGPESKLTVFEAASRLDNDGQRMADPKLIAFGGMMTFVDTAAPAPSSDLVGPVSSKISLSPNPSNGLAPVTVTADLSDATTGGSNVAQAELVVDDAVLTAPGFGTAMSGAFGTVTVTGATGTISVAALDALAAGKHQVFVRAQDSAGNWGVVGSAILNLPKTGPQTTGGSAADVPANGTQDVVISATGDDRATGGTITAAEYFVDTVGADGSGTAMARNRTASVVSETATIAAADVLALGDGVHHVFVHSKNSLGLWGPPLSIDLTVDLAGPTVDAASVGPNPTNAVLSDKGNPGYLLVSAQITDPVGDGATSVAGTVADAEAFLDPTGVPAGGTGLQLVAVDGSMGSTTEAVYGLIPLSQVKALSNGMHHVAVRGQDGAGTWGDMFTVDLLVDKTAPVLGTLTASPNPTNGAVSTTLSAPLTEANTIARAEFWVGTTDPGAGKATTVPVSVASGTANAVIPLTTVPRGVQQFNLRVMDGAGNWSNKVAVQVNVIPPNGIFSDGFDNGTTWAWSSRTGNVSMTPAAGIPPTVGNQGLQVAITSTSRPASYVQDSTPTAEPTYHAQFSFNRNTFTTNTTSAVTVFQTLTSANGTVFSVQLRNNGGTRQLRTVLSRSTQAALTGGWVDLASGARTVRVDWTAATAGSLRLLVDGVTVQTQNGNTSSLRIETARLGAVAGLNTSTTGTMYFDSFVSTRNTIP